MKYLPIDLYNSFFINNKLIKSSPPYERHKTTIFPFTSHNGYEAFRSAALKSGFRSVANGEKKYDYLNLRGLENIENAAVELALNNS